MQWIKYCKYFKLRKEYENFLSHRKHCRSFVSFMMSRRKALFKLPLVGFFFQRNNSILKVHNALYDSVLNSFIRRQYPPGLEEEPGGETTPPGMKVVRSLHGDPGAERVADHCCGPQRRQAPGSHDGLRWQSRQQNSGFLLEECQEERKPGRWALMAQVRVGGASREPGPNCLACVELCRGVCTWG